MKVIKRPGEIITFKTIRFDAKCELCEWYVHSFILYEDADKALDRHLETYHPGWEKKGKYEMHMLKGNGMVDNLKSGDIS